MNRADYQIDLDKRVGRMQEILGKSENKDEFDRLAKEITEIGETCRAMDKADAESRDLRAALSLAPRPAGPVVAESGWGEVRKQLKAALDSGKRSAINLASIEGPEGLMPSRESRALVTGGAGTNTAPGIVRALVDGGHLRSKVSTYLGKNSVTVVSVLSPTMALPVGSVPGATGTASDSTAVLAGLSLTLKPWYSTIAVSMGAVISTAIDSVLPSSFSDVFGGAIDKGICVGAGSGSDMLGIFIASATGVPTASDISCAAAGAPLWVDYVNMAMQLLALSGDFSSLAIVVNPTVFNVALASAVAGTDPLKTAYLMTGAILGIPVILSSYALTTLTAGSYVAVGGYFKHYALAIAQEIYIDQIKTVGSDNITFQAFMYMQGNPAIGSSFRRLKTV